MLTRRTHEQLIHMRQGVLDQYREHRLTRSEASQLLGMHPNAVSRLASRYTQFGASVLVGKKPGPKKCTPKNRTSEEIVSVVTAVALKHPELGPKPLSWELSTQWGINLHSTTVWRILKREQIRYTTEYRRWKDNPTLYCLDTPGEELQMDACFPWGRSRKIASFDAVDDCSRWGWGRCTDQGETTDQAILFATELVRRSPFRIQRLRVDNRYGDRFKRYCKDILGITVIENEPYHPEQNGKIERFHRTVKEQFFFRHCRFDDSMELINYKYAQWWTFYNERRPHSGLGMNDRTPVQKLVDTYLQATANTVITSYPQYVTGILQQYKI